MTRSGGWSQDRPLKPSATTTARISARAVETPARDAFLTSLLEIHKSSGTRYVGQKGWRRFDQSSLLPMTAPALKELQLDLGVAFVGNRGGFAKMGQIMIPSYHEEEPAVG